MPTGHRVLGGAEVNDVAGATLACGDEAAVGRVARVGLAGLAGGLMVPIYALNADMGVPFLIKSFLAVMLGGMGSFEGSVAGAALVGATTAALPRAIKPVVADEDRSFVSSARDLLPDEPWDGTTWKIWTDAVKATTGRKGKALFMPLRLALTGLDHGPELAQLLPLIGREKALERLS